MKVKKKKCKECKTYFKPFRTTQIVCSALCAVKYQKSKTKQKESRIRQMKEDLVTPNQYRKNKLQPVVNEIIRLIDFGQPCICRPNEIGTDAGHFISTGANLTLSLNFHNIHIQCRNSNGFRGGESLLYYDGLISVYGQEYADYCKALQQCESLNLTKDEMKEARKKLMPFRLHLRKTIDKAQDIKTRIELRNEANNIAKLYPLNYSVFQI